MSSNTYIGLAVTQLLRRHFERYVDLKFTAEMEQDLDRIASGEVDGVDFLSAFYRGAGPEARGLLERIERDVAWRQIRIEGTDQAAHRRAQLSRTQAQDALDNLDQLVEVDVRIAYIEVNRTKQQITATSVTRRFNEEKLRTETEKLRVGKSTSFLVAQAQRDLLVSRIAEVQALANYLKALIDLYRQDGSLLERRGIAAPGREPVDLSRSPHS